MHLLHSAWTEGNRKPENWAFFTRNTLDFFKQKTSVNIDMY